SKNWYLRLRWGNSLRSWPWAVAWNRLCSVSPEVTGATRSKRSERFAQGNQARSAHRFGDPAAIFTLSGNGSGIHRTHCLNPPTPGSLVKLPDARCRLQQIHETLRLAQDIAAL